MSDDSNHRDGNGEPADRKSRTGRLADHLAATWKYFRRGLVSSKSLEKPFIPGIGEDGGWRAVLNGDAEKACPASFFRELSDELRAAGDLAAAERVCSRGVLLYPDNLWLAQIHARIAEAAGDNEARASRWSRVIGMSGDSAPANAFKGLADFLLESGDCVGAEAIVRSGMELYPEDLPLADRLCKLLRLQGRSQQAIELWEQLISRFPEIENAWLYRSIASTYRAEGLLHRAAATLETARMRYPDDPALAIDIHRLDTLRGSLLPPQATLSDEYTAHLYGGNTTPFGRGKVSYPNEADGINQYVPAMLDFAECVAPLSDPNDADDVDVFTNWGWCGGWTNTLARNLAVARGKPSLSLEFGFISCPGLPIHQSPGHSIIVCPDVIYFDATQPTTLENKLNSDTYQLDETQEARARACIDEIVNLRLTKYNHAPQIDLRPRFPDNGRKRVLLVDQRFGDRAVGFGLGGEATFRRMWETALALPDHDIILKLHPDAISGKYGSYLGRLVQDTPPPNVTLLDFDINPFCLFEVVDKVFICSSQLGLEALMAGCEVHCFGMPFYAGWGLTVDHIAVPRRHRSRSIEEVFHLFYIDHSRYFVPGPGIVPLEELLAYFAHPSSKEAPQVFPLPEPAVESRTSPRVLIVAPGGRFDDTGRHVHSLAQGLVRNGCHVTILAEAQSDSPVLGVVCQQMVFEGPGLASSVRESIIRFEPDVVYAIGNAPAVRRTAFEALILSQARLAVHTEASDSAKGCDSDSESLSADSSQQPADLRTVAWHASGTSAEPGFTVVPPVCTVVDFTRLPLADEDRARILSSHSIPSDSTVFFIGGTLPIQADEYESLLHAIDHAYQEYGGKIAVVIVSSRSPLPMHRMACELLHPGIFLADLGDPSNPLHLEMLKACDVVCPPGSLKPNGLNQPSQFLAAAMAMGKPILSQRSGFGESLDHGVNAFVMQGESPVQWAAAIRDSLDADARRRVGSNARDFARRYFDPGQVASNLKKRFMEILSQPPRSNFPTGPTDSSESREGADSPASIPLGDRYASSLQDAIHVVATRTHRLDTVVHLGAGSANELSDYCRLGARHILLVEGDPAVASDWVRLRNYQERVIVKKAVISESGGQRQLYRLASARPGGAPPEISLLKPSALQQHMPGIICSPGDATPTLTFSGILTGVPLDGPDNLLMLELNGLEIQILRATPGELLQAFHWLAFRLSPVPLFEGAETKQAAISLLQPLGFRLIAGQASSTSIWETLVFERGA